MKKDLPKKKNKHQLPDDLNDGIKDLSRVLINDAKAYSNSSQPVHIPGQEKNIQEPWHVIQQEKGRVAPTLQIKTGTVNDDNELEKHADDFK